MKFPFQQISRGFLHHEYSRRATNRDLALSFPVVAPGALATQFDYALPDQRPASCVSTILPVGELPAGDYDLFAIVYDAQTGDRLAQNGDDKALLESISLGE